FLLKLTAQVLGQRCSPTPQFRKSDFFRGQTAHRRITRSRGIALQFRFGNRFYQTVYLRARHLQITRDFQGELIVRTGAIVYDVISLIAMGGEDFAYSCDQINHISGARPDVYHCPQPLPLSQRARCETEEIILFAGAEDPGSAYDIALRRGHSHRELTRELRLPVFVDRQSRVAVRVE